MNNTELVQSYRQQINNNVNQFNLQLFWNMYNRCTSAVSDRQTCSQVTEALQSSITALLCVFQSARPGDESQRDGAQRQDSEVSVCRRTQQDHEFLVKHGPHQLASLQI